MRHEQGIPPARWRAVVSRVDGLLLTDWDPIGVKDCEGAFDEYSSYAPGLTRFALRGNVGAVADQLASLRTERMGLQANAAVDLAFAERLVALVAVALTEQ